MRDLKTFPQEKLIKTLREAKADIGAQKGAGRTLRQIIQRQKLKSEQLHDQRQANLLEVQQKALVRDLRGRAYRQLMYELGQSESTSEGDDGDSSSCSSNSRAGDGDQE